jgi:uncharacterized protein
MLRRAFILAFVLAAAWPRPLAAQSAVGRWEGAIKVMGQELAIVVTIAGDASAPQASIDIPLQGVKGLGLTNVRVNGQLMHFELPAPQGTGVFDGVVRGDQATGTFEQATVKGTFELKRGPAAEEPPPPYRQEDVKVENGGITLAGTLTLPTGPGPHPALVLITGSGAQNRDEEVFGFKVFKVLADHLTRAGFAVLRCDDRGVGGSTGSTPQSTTADFAEDALAQLKFLRGRPEIDKGRIGLLGHSEGGIVAPMAATKSPDVAFIVLMSGPALPGDQLMLAQGELIARAEGRTPEEIKSNVRVQQLLFAAVRSGTVADQAVAAAAAKSAARTAFEKLPEAQRKAIPDPERLLAAQVESQMAFVRTPWFKFFLDYDPAPALLHVSCPVLALFAERDLQVPTDANRTVMESIAKKSGNPDWTIKVIPGANHLYQAATTGSPSEYARLKKEFAPGVVDTLISWLQGHAKKRL